MMMSSDTNLEMMFELEGLATSGALELSGLWTFSVVGSVTLQLGEVWKLFAALSARLERNNTTFKYMGWSPQIVQTLCFI